MNSKTEVIERLSREGFDVQPYDHGHYTEAGHGDRRIRIYADGSIIGFGDGISRRVPQPLYGVEQAVGFLRPEGPPRREVKTVTK